MKVIVLTPNYPRKGALMNGYFIHQQIKALREAGVDCQVILTHNWFPPLGLHKFHPYWRLGHTQKNSYFTSYEGVPIHHVPAFVKMPSRFFSEDHYYREANAIARYVKNTPSLANVNFIYANFLTDIGYIGAIVKEKLRIKLVAIARGDDVHAWPEKDKSLVSNLHYVFSRADLLLATSDRLGEDARKWFEPGFDKKTFTVYNGIDFNRFFPLLKPADKEVLRRKFNLPVDKKLLLCVATPVKLKGWIELLDALGELRENLQNWKLVAVTPPRRNDDALDLQQEVTARSLQNNFIWLGPVDPQNMPDCYRSMDAFVLPSYNEGLSNSVVEALASGLPVITTDVGGHAEIIHTGENGILVPPQNSKLLMDALRRVMTDETTRAKFAGKAVDSCQAIGSYQSNALKLVGLIRQHFKV